MTRPGGRITVAKSVVTGIRIDPTTRMLTVEGVDQDRDGNTLRSHVLTFDAADTKPDSDRPASRMRLALAEVATFAQLALDEA